MDADPRFAMMVAMDATSPFEFDDDSERIDLDVVWGFLSTEAYWGRQRSREIVERQVREAWRVVGAYDAAFGSMVGFARAVSDGVAYAYLADLFVLSESRGRGLGQRLVRVMIDEGPGAEFRWALHTDDAHELYRPFGFSPPGPAYLERPSRWRAGAQGDRDDEG